MVLLADKEPGIFLGVTLGVILGVGLGVDLGVGLGVYDERSCASIGVLTDDFPPPAIPAMALAMRLPASESLGVAEEVHGRGLARLRTPSPPGTEALDDRARRRFAASLASCTGEQTHGAQEATQAATSV